MTCPVCGGKCYGDATPGNPSAVFHCDTCDYELNLNEVESTYQSVQAGSDNPSHMEITCPECHETFELSLNGDNQVCEHITWLHRALWGKS